jgi:DNA-directed RNA polymerase omega subunit
LLFDIEKLEKCVGNRYDLILVAAKRVYQLHHGAKPLVDIKKLGISKLTDIALAEILAGKVNEKGLPVEEEKPSEN